MSTQWPFPGDAPLIRARKCAWAYRAALAELKPEIAADLDDRLARKWGERWIIGTAVAYQPDDWVDSREAGDILGMSPARVGQLRIHGRIKGVLEDGKRFKYKVADLYELSTQHRRRGWNFRRGSQNEDAADTVSADGPRAPTEAPVSRVAPRAINVDYEILRREWAPTVATGMVQCAALVCLQASSWIPVDTDWDLDHLPHIRSGTKTRPVHKGCKLP